MPIPSHGPKCRTAFCYPNRCPHCHKDVFYYACTCGSTLLFDSLGDPWPVHKCAKKSPLLPLRSSAERRPAAATSATNPMLPVECEVCGKKVRWRDMKEHMSYTHRQGIKPSIERLSGASVSTLTRMAKPMAGSFVACPLCDARMLRKSLEKHLTKKCPNRKR